MEGGESGGKEGWREGRVEGVKGEVIFAKEGSESRNVPVEVRILMTYN